MSSALLCLAAMISSQILADGNRSARFIAITDAPEVFRSQAETTVELPAVDPGFDWNELIVSWNVEPAGSTALAVEAKVVYPDRETKWYTLGLWSLDPNFAPRESVDGQKDDDGRVMTDTLHMERPGGKVVVRLTGRAGELKSPAMLNLLGLSFSNTKIAAPESDASEHPAWGKVVDVPMKRQRDYPNGGVLCSPTAVSMVLNFYAYILNRPDLRYDVPAIQAGVYDPVYKGTGNWPFNTAFVGSLMAMRGYVTRFGSLDHLESWIDEGLPVVCSVSYQLLRGKELNDKESGHLVVLVGFEKNGDPIFNDPAAENVRITYKRSDFEKAWSYSKRTVYLIYPRTVLPPEGSNGYWLESPMEH